MIVKHNIIFLDTNIFESENFTEGKKLNQLLQLTKENGIQIKIVDIAYQECLKRIDVNLIKAKSTFKKARALLNNEGRVLRQLIQYKSHYNIPSKIDIEADFQALKNLFDNFLKENSIEIVPSDIANHEEIFSLYFEKKIPFGENQKKDQFPDAFILNTIEHWCRLNGMGAYLISSDNDIVNFNSGRFEIVAGIVNMLNLLVEASELYDAVYEILTDKIDIAIKDLKKSINNYSDDFSILLYNRLLTDPDYLELEYDPGEILKVEFPSLLITSLENNLIRLDLKAFVDIRLPLTYNDLSMATYDREDDRYWNVFHVEENSIYRLDLSFSADFEYEIKDKEVLNFSLTSIDDYSLYGYEKIEESIQTRSEFAD
ncbi:MAG: PIN domain-containing protein [Flavobacteriaceae bacterium]